VGLLDQTRYPFDHPDGRELLDILADSYKPSPAEGFCERAGIRTAIIDFRGSAREVWRKILESAAKSGQLRALAQVIIDDRESTAVRPLLRRLLEEAPGAAPTWPTVRVGEVMPPPTTAHRGRNIVRTLTGHRARVRGLAFSPDQALLVSAGDDNRVLAWDITTGGARSLTGHTDAVSSVAFSPDGHLLASASADATIRLWDIPAGTARSLTGHTDAVSSVAFSPDGHLLASASADATIRLWDIPSG